MKLFDYLKAMTVEKKDLDFSLPEVKKGYQPYMISRFVSMVDMYIPLVNEINKHEVPKDIHYKFFNSVLPKRYQYFNYIKKPKDLEESEKRYIADYFEIGMREAEMYIKILDEDQIKQIVETYRYGKDTLAEV